MSSKEERVKEIREKNTKYYYKGFLLFGIGVLVVFVGFLSNLFTILLIMFSGGFFLIMFGFYYLYKSFALLNIMRSMEIIQQIEPDKLIVTEDFVVGKKGDVYLPTKSTHRTLSLIRFNDLVETDEKKIKIKLPKFEIGRRKKIAGMSIHYARGRYTIPISEDKYATGDAVSYTFFTETEFLNLIPIDQRPPKERLMALIEELRQEII